MTTIRCKMVLRAMQGNPGGDGKTVHCLFEAVADNETEENRRFYSATPSGKLEVVINNPQAHAELAEGKTYFVDLIPAG